MFIKFKLSQHNQMWNIQATKSMQNTLDRFTFVVIKQFAYDQIPTNAQFTDLCESHEILCIDAKRYAVSESVDNLGLRSNEYW